MASFNPAVPRYNPDVPPENPITDPQYRPAQPEPEIPLPQPNTASPRQTTQPVENPQPYPPSHDTTPTGDLGLDILGGPTKRRGMVSNPGETDAQTYQRYQQNYWAPDRASVLSGPQQTATGTVPKGGNLKDPAYVDQLIAYYGNQPGADPSLKNDPNYWKQKILSGELGGDEGYIVGKMQNAWKGDGGSGGGPGAPGGGIDPKSVADPAVHDAIMRLLARGENPLSPNDPTLQAQFLPQRNVLERQQQLQNASAAERNAAAGTNVGGGGGATQGEQASIAENTGAQEGSMMGQLVTNELASRRADVANALQFAQGEEKNQLSIQLANLDAAIRRQQLTQQNQQFYDQYVQNQGFHNDTLDAELARMLGQ